VAERSIYGKEPSGKETSKLEWRAPPVVTEGVSKASAATYQAYLEELGIYISLVVFGTLSVRETRSFPYLQLDRYWPKSVSRWELGKQPYRTNVSTL
jgi:hypothetical protein